MIFSSGVMQISVGSKVISATSISVCGTTLNAGEVQKAVYRIQNCDFDLKEYQKVAISFLLKGDVFGCAPTGSGKSIIYQLSPIAM